ncbi:MAG TPA: phosphoribosylanthranilate isomerase [Roseiflexaceae bacterium]|nr:phosphoribosylanthranilate isomerase [Roseiflexaceae bacterium]
MTLVKICGLRTIEHALAAADAGADMLGFVFAPSRRQISPEAAAAIVQAVRAKPAERPVTIVGLFVNAAPDRMLAIARQCGLDAIQLSGDETSDLADRLPGYTLLKAIRLGGAPSEAGWLEPSPAQAVRLLIDAHVPGSYGGAGVLADWDRAAALARQRPIMLAGGLTPENVGAAIRQVRPWGVDVSSGVEIDGAKDAAKIRAFVGAARASDRQLANEQTLSR